MLIAESDEATRTDMLESVLRLGLVVHAFSSLDGALDGLAQRECDVLVVSLRFGIAEVMALLQYARGSPECGGLPILVLGGLVNLAITDLMGGARVPMIGNVIQNQFGQARDWPFGAALGMTLLLLFSVFFLLGLRKEPER